VWNAGGERTGKSRQTERDGGEEAVAYPGINVAGTQELDLRSLTSSKRKGGSRKSNSKMNCVETDGRWGGDQLLGMSAVLA
jgi:hypothetical protein